MSDRAVGTFDVQLAPVPNDVSDLGIMSIDKRFDGDLVGTSSGHMLAVSTQTPGSAAYVAIERVVGTLHGRSGSFVLHHTGVMDRGASTLSVSVVPDSGTDELVGLTGSMTIDAVDGSHEYTFEYAL
jgi:hypothetical protein